MLETIFLRHLIKYWEKNNLFYNCQFGFQKQRSTSFAITYLHELILEQRDGSDSVSDIFLDFAKAFDCVEHQILLEKLKHYGVKGNVLKLLSWYLTNRFQFILNNDEQIFSNL